MFTISHAAISERNHHLVDGRTVGEHFVEVNAQSEAQTEWRKSLPVEFEIDVHEGNKL